MAMQANVLREGKNNNFSSAIGTITFTTNPDTYATGGMTLNLGSITSLLGNNPIVFITGTSGYQYQYVAGSNRTNGKVKILISDDTNVMAEIGAGNLPAGAQADSISFVAFYI